MNFGDCFKPPIRAVVVDESWCGHGEGGTITKVRIVGWRPENTYDSTENDKRKCQEVADLINNALRSFEARSEASVNPSTSK